MTDLLNDQSEDAVVRLANVFGWARVLVALAESPALERMMRELELAQDGQTDLLPLATADAAVVLEAMDTQFAGLAGPLHK